MRNAPSMTGLRAFDAVLRHGTLSGAARELCVTPAAISHRLRALESISGRSLVYRDGGRFLATETGLLVKAALGDAFDSIRRADAVLSQNSGKTLTVAVSYSFGVMWLIPHLHAFELMNSDTSLYIQPSHDPLSVQGSDIVIAQLNTPPARGQWTHLFDDYRAVMCRRSHPILSGPHFALADVLKADLLHIAFRHTGLWGQYSWQEWAAAKGLGKPPAAVTAQVTAEHMAVEMIQHRDSLALVTTTTVADYVTDGRLAVLPGSTVRTQYAYWARVVASDPVPNRLASQFIDWMQARLAAAEAVPV